MDFSNNWPCWSGFSWDRKYFPEPEAFLSWCKARGVHNALNLHFQSGLQREEDRFEEVLRPGAQCRWIEESCCALTTLKLFATHLDDSSESHFG